MYSSFLELVVFCTVVDSCFCFSAIVVELVCIVAYVFGLVCVMAVVNGLVCVVVVVVGLVWKVVVVNGLVCVVAYIVALVCELVFVIRLVCTVVLVNGLVCEVGVWLTVISSEINIVKILMMYRLARLFYQWLDFKINIVESSYIRIFLLLPKERQYIDWYILVTFNSILKRFDLCCFSTNANSSMSVRPSVCPYVCLYVRLYVRLSGCMSVCLYMSVSLYKHVSLSVSFHFLQNIYHESVCIQRIVRDSLYQHCITYPRYITYQSNLVWTCI